MEQNDLSQKSNFSTPKLQKVSSIKSNSSYKSKASREKKISRRKTANVSNAIGGPVGVSVGVPEANIQQLHRKLSIHGLGELNSASGLTLAHLFDEVEKFKERTYQQNVIQETEEVEEDPSIDNQTCDDVTDEDEELFYTEDDLRRMFQERIPDYREHDVIDCDDDSIGKPLERERNL